jgi:hypothetical protein
MLFAATIFTADGAVIASSDEITLDPGEPHSFLFNRDDLPLVGEGGTGRLQVRAQVRRRFFHGIVDRFSQGKLREFRSVAELVDNGTGRTTAVLVTTGFFEVAPPREPQ